MNIAIIFAGGVGTRMNTKDRPKQFLMVHEEYRYYFVGLISFFYNYYIWMYYCSN